MVCCGRGSFVLFLLLPLLLHAQTGSQGWIPSGSPLPPWPQTLQTTPAGDLVLVTDFDGIYRSQDNGNSWQKIGDPFGDRFELWAVTLDSIGPVCAYSLPGVRYTTDHGIHWLTATSADTALETGLMTPAGIIVATGMDSDKHSQDPGNPYGLWQGTYVSTDAGKSWKRCTSGPGRFRNPLITPGGSFLAVANAADGNRICRTSDGGVTWTGSTFPCITFLVPRSDGSILAGAGDRLLISKDDGKSWSMLGDIWTTTNTASAATVDRDGYIITGWAVRGGDGYAGPIQMAISADTGKTWRFVMWQERIVDLFSLHPLSDGKVLAVTYAGIYASIDHGFTWQPVSDDFPNRRVSCFASAPDGKTCYAGTDRGVYLSADDGVHWSKMAFPADVFTASGETRVLSLGVSREGRVCVKLPLTSVITTNDDGKTWTPKAAFDSIGTCMALDTAGRLLEGTFGGTLLRSTDIGLTWNPWGFCPGGSMVTSLKVGPDNTVYATTPLGGVLKSVGGQGAGTSIGFQKRSVQDIVIHQTGVLIVATRDSIFRSTSGGAVWSPPDSGSPVQSFIYSLALAPGGEVLVSGSMGVLISTDAGRSWHAINEGLPGDTVVSVVVTPNGHIIAGTTAGSYWSATFLDVRDITANEPNATTLFQNYPNPFNPTTTIRYSLPHRAHVTLTVFNTLGQKVAELVNGEVSAGSCEVQFNAGNLASGMYFYRLQAGSFFETKRLCVLR